MMKRVVVVFNVVYLTHFIWSKILLNAKQLNNNDCLQAFLVQNICYHLNSWAKDVFNYTIYQNIESNTCSNRCNQSNNSAIYRMHSP